MTFIDLIMEDEGERLLVYDDATGKPLKPGDKLIGHPTIGRGRALDVKGISREESIYLCKNDEAEITWQATREFPWFSSLSYPRQMVIMSMIFNMGLDGFKEFKGMIESIELKDFNSAAAEMLDSKWARDQVRERAHKLAKMMISGEAP